MITRLIYLIALTATCNTLVFDILCKITDEIAIFYKIDQTNKEEVKDGSSLNPNLTTYFVIHGWGGSAAGDYTDIGRSLSAFGNTLLVDYEELGKKFYGTCAFIIVDKMSQYVAKWIMEQSNAGYMHPSRIHLVGHSLGGQGAGRIGREVERLTGVKIKRISALDPAGPLFSFTVIPAPAVCLKSTDAEIVDVLHTTMTAGVMASIGTVDFFANSFKGYIKGQPGCGFLGVVCSHGRSKEYFLESINSCGFVGIKDGSGQKAVYGLHMSRRATGTYLFDTNAASPFAKRQSNCRKQHTCHKRNHK